MPWGLYDTGPPRFERGALAIVCLEGDAAHRARARGYVPRGDCASGLAPIVKEIVALPGDVVVVREDGTRVCAEYGGTAWVSADLRGRPLSRRQIGSRVLQDGEYWLLGMRRQVSWDSRYFGVVEKDQIIGSATPWLTWNGLPRP